MQIKNKDTTLLRTMLNTQLQNFATKRLLTDLKEIQNSKNTTIGVIAHPLEHDLFVWHANIRGPENTPYEGGVWHLELTFPQIYPHEPPKICLFSDLPHPNVFGHVLCLDMLEGVRKTNGEGWTSAYSILSILLQLQSFLFQQHISDKPQKINAKIKEAIVKANEFRCTTKSCKHGGKLSAWPQFTPLENDLKNFQILDTPSEIFERELVCYHTKLPYKQ